METLHDIGKMKRVSDGRHRVEYPACTIGRNGKNYYCYLNSIARSHFEAAQGVNWYQNENYIIALPSPAVNAYKPIIKTKKGSYSGYSFPSKLVFDPVNIWKAYGRECEGTVKPGMYKLYRYKNGFAFKPYEPIKEDEV